MINPEKSTREAFVDVIPRMGEVYPDLWVVDADSGSLTGASSFADNFPDRYCNTGIAEQQQALLSSGLALSGKRVVAVSQASFLVSRSYDQIRNSIAIPGLPVTFIATHAGVSCGEEGAVTQMLEDLALMRALPNFKVLAPADYWSARHLIEASIGNDDPVYIRLGRMPLPLVYSRSDADFSPGGGRMLVEGTGVTICACGIMVHEALKAAEILSQQDLSAEVIDCYSVQPLPSQVILASVRRTGCCVVAEEHVSRGGLGEAVAALITRNYPVPVKFVSVEDRFGQSGRTEELREYYGLTGNQVVSSAVQAWTMRRR